MEQNAENQSAMVTSVVGLALSSLGLPGWIVSAIARGKCKKLIEAGEPVAGQLKVANILSRIGLPVSIVMTVIYVLYFILGVALGVSQYM